MEESKKYKDSSAQKENKDPSTKISFLGNTEVSSLVPAPHYAMLTLTKTF